MNDDRLGEVCRKCKRPLGDDLERLEYSKDSELRFCSERCKRDWLDGLPPGSLILQDHTDDVDPTPWGAKYGGDA